MSGFVGYTYNYQHLIMLGERRWVIVNLPVLYLFVLVSR
ncbi:putative membrane protein [Citrobacter rodentium ICC168]|uniref:Membrane protein n=1 Tax=Citrobacter rodentium (strain ICC168) TaxID=637910 RepID=D2TT14_CITRI|nr:putative membrane protein [Citrobacter rodentium ICC168]